jgi:hypothetical protein
VLKRLRNDLLDFLIVLGHDDLAVVVNKLDHLLNREHYTIAFELVEDLVDFFPVESALDVGLAIKA